MPDNDQDISQDSALVIEEQAVVAKDVSKSGNITVTSKAVSHTEMIQEIVQHHGAQIDRVNIDREIDAVPEIRQEGDLLYIPVVEEVVVITKRLMLREEIVVRRTVETEQTEIPVTLRRTEVAVERE